MAEYDEDVIAKYASALYSRANMIIFYHVLIYGVLAWAAMTYFLLDYIVLKDVSLREPAKYMCMFVCGFIGYSIGSQKAMSLKLQAQMALCYAEIEKNTRGYLSGPLLGLQKTPSMTSL